MMKLREVSASHHSPFIYIEVCFVLEDSQLSLLWSERINVGEIPFTRLEVKDEVKATLNVRFYDKQTCV